MLANRSKTVSLAACVFLAAAAAMSVPAYADDGKAGEPAAAASAAEQPKELQQWHGEAPARVDALAQQLGDVVDRHREEFAGLALARDRQSVNVYLVAGNDVNDFPELAYAMKENPGFINVIRADHSYSELLTLQDQYSEELLGKGLVAAAVDIVNNGLKLTVESGSTAETLAHSQTRSTAERVKISVESSEPASNAAGRYNDFPNFIWVAR
ncbi:MAG: hypothetical protein SPF30_03335 [Arcanobacterium sp.]|nr:hypothetical protein [Arcanobacterium sp.]